MDYGSNWDAIWYSSDKNTMICKPLEKDNEAQRQRQLNFWKYQLIKTSKGITTTINMTKDRCSDRAATKIECLNEVVNDYYQKGEEFVPLPQLKRKLRRKTSPNWTQYGKSLAWSLGAWTFNQVFGSIGSDTLLICNSLVKKQTESLRKQFFRHERSNSLISFNEFAKLCFDHLDLPRGDSAILLGCLIVDDLASTHSEGYLDLDDIDDSLIINLHFGREDAKIDGENVTVIQTLKILKELQARAKILEKDIDKITEAMKTRIAVIPQHKRRDDSILIIDLKRRHNKTKSLGILKGKISNLEVVLDQIRQSQSDREVIQAYKLAQQTIKNLTEELKGEDLDQLEVDLSSAVDDVASITEQLNSGMKGILDEEDEDELWQEFMKEEGEGQIVNFPKVLANSPPKSSLSSFKSVASSFASSS